MKDVKGEEIRDKREKKLEKREYAMKKKGRREDARDTREEEGEKRMKT